LQNLACFCNFATDVAKYAKNYFCADEGEVMRNYNFNTKLYGYNTLIEIFNILDDKIEIIDKVLILPDNYEELIGDR
jgi:hypothetical protein